MINFTVMITLEICSQSYQAALNAYHGGAHRIELCADLLTGGITPDINITKSVCRELSIPTFVLIRPRDGNFYYSHSELSVIQDQIKAAVDAGAAGIVCGALTEKNEIDTKALQIMLHAAQGLPFTFHRAFEKVEDSFATLDLLVAYGVSRILTGGKSGNAYHSRLELKDLNEYAGNRIIILGGSGVTHANVASLIQDAHLVEVHSSAKYGSLAIADLNPNDTDQNEVRRLLESIYRAS